MGENSSKVHCATQSGSIWIIGWMFTIGFAKITFWQALLGLIIWPYYLGCALAA